MGRILVEVVELFSRIRAFFAAKRVAGRTELLMQPVERTARAAGLSARTVVCLYNEVYAASRPWPGKRERRVIEGCITVGVCLRAGCCVQAI